MANKPFAIQGSTLTIGGVELQAGTTGVVLPGVTQAVNYQVEEVDERDGSNPDVFGSNTNAVTVIDNSRYLQLTGTAPSADYVAATYSVDELDDGEIQEVTVETEGVFLAADKTRAEVGNMWATLDATPFTSFTAGNWTQIPYRPKFKAGEVENVGGGDSIDNGNYSVSVADTGVVTMDTSRGTLEFGALPEPGGTYHFHVMKGAGQDGSGGMDLYFGDDYNYVLQRADSYQGSPAYGVEIGAKDLDGGDQHVWRFDTDGDLHIPPGKTIRDALTGNDLLDGGTSGGTVIASKVWVQEFATSLGAADVPLVASGVEYLANGDVVALFMHVVNNESSAYSGIARFNSAGTRVWSMNFAGSVYTTGWGLAVDNTGGYIYVAGQKSAATGYAVATLTKLSQADGDIVWSKQYDVGYANNNLVVDVASDGNPVVVGYADNGTDNQVVTTKIDSADGSVTWSKALNGQGDEEAYGMAVGSNGEMVSVGWMDQHNEQLTRSVTPQTGSGTGILVINRSDLSGATFTDSWKVAGTGITGTANVGFINTYSSVTGTVRQGSGASFNIINNGNGTYTVLLEFDGLNYLSGHKIKVLGSELGGVDSVNDCTITIYTTGQDGMIVDVSHSGTAAGTQMHVYSGRSGTNFETGSGLTFTLNLDSGSTYTEHTFNIIEAGTNYVSGDVVVVSGTQLGGTSPANDLTLTVNAADGQVLTMGAFSGTQQTTTYRIVVIGSLVNFGGAGTWTLSNSVTDTDNRMLVVKYALSDGAIDWQASVQVEAGLDCKGADADIDGGGNIYVCGNFEQDGGANFTKMIIFKLDTAGVKQWSRKVEGTCEDFATSIVFGSDGYLYLSAVTNTGSDFSMVIAKYDTNGNVIWQRLLDNTTSWTFGGQFFLGNGGGSNLAVKDGYVAVSGSFGDPTTTAPHAIVAQFESDGTEIILGDYDFVAASFNGVLDNTASEITVTGAAKTDLDRSESFTVTDFSPTVDLTSDLIGTRYSSPSGTIGSVKLTAPNSRKIEEAFGYNSVSVTSRFVDSTVTTTPAFANSGNQNQVTVNVSTPQFEELVALVNSNTFYYFEVSLDQNSWRRAGYSGYSGSEPLTFTFGLSGGVTLFVNGGTTVYYRIVTGADPVVWWDSADLPSGSNNFRGAVIDYHAYTGESTIIGTIHIVNDDGEEHITHTEVQSGTSDGENDYLWLVQNEGTVSYYRIDGESKTLKVQWTAKVFYGSEYYDD